MKGRFLLQHELDLNEDEEKDSCNDSEEYSIDQVVEYKHTLNTLKEDIMALKAMLGRKRKTEEEIVNVEFDEYDKFLMKFYGRDGEAGVQGINPEEYVYLYSKLKSHVLGEKIQQKRYLNGKRIVGLCPSDLFRHEKYQVDIKNMPKFSKIFERVGGNDEYASESRIYLPTDTDKLNKKRQTLSCIERHNSEAIRAIEEKRQKCKNLPKAQKERMDNNNLNKVWNWIAKREIPRFHRLYQKARQDNNYNLNRFAVFAQKEVKKKAAKVQRSQKEVNLRARRLQKEMMVFWRKRDKEMLEIKK
jgi:hypothetical protein